MYCPKCGKEIEQGKKFCPDCGPDISQEQNNTSRKIIKLIAILIIAAAVILGVTRLHGEGGKNALVGTWICTSDDEWLISFEEDGSFYDSDNYFLSGYYGYGDGYVGTWRILEDNKLYLSGEDSKERLDFELDGNVLTIYVENSAQDYYQFQKE